LRHARLWWTAAAAAADDLPTTPGIVDGHAMQAAAVSLAVLSCWHRRGQRPHFWGPLHRSLSIPLSPFDF
jgi:hypothetical protein